MIDFVFFAVLFVLPILNVILFFRQIHSFFRTRNNNRVLKNLCYEFVEGDFPVKRPTVLLRFLQKNNTPGHQREVFMKHYRRLYCSVLIYCISTIVFTAFWILYLVLTFFVFDRTYSDFRVFLIISSGIILIGLELPPILKSMGGVTLNRAAHLIEHLMKDLISPSGKIYLRILNLGYTVLILLVNLALFRGYTQLGTLAFVLFSIEDNLVHNLILLLIYQYPLVYITSRIINRIYHDYMCKVNKQPAFNFEYLQMTLKNNTYLLYLLFYLVGKSLQIDSNSSVGTTMIEAIGILYLIDTYFDKRDQCEKTKADWKKTQPPAKPVVVIKRA